MNKSSRTGEHSHSPVTFEAAEIECCPQQTADQKPQQSADQDSCCETPAKRDWVFIGSVLIIALAYPFGAFVEHPHDSAVAIFSAGVFELFNQMWWGIAIGIVFVGILARIPRELVMGVLGREEGVGGLFRATLAGVFLDLCSHGILAVGMKL